jgi:hypothetical protein
MDITKITKQNLPIFLSVFLEQNKVSVEKVAKSIGCSAPTLNRIIAQKSVGTNELLKQSAIMVKLGYKRYDKLTNTEKEKISGIIGTVSGTGLGFASISSAVGVLGSTGLSAVGITSGLGALGGFIGGGMIAGVVVAAAIPIAVGAAGYGMTKGIKSLFTHIKVKNEEFDNKWEESVSN